MSDQELPYPRLQRAALDIFDGLGAIAEQTGSEVVDALGELAVYAAEHGVDDEAQQWLDRLTKATERVQRALHKIATALNDIPDGSAYEEAEQESPTFEGKGQDVPVGPEVDAEVGATEPETGVAILEPDERQGLPEGAQESAAEADVVPDQDIPGTTTEVMTTEIPAVETPAQEPKTVSPEKLPEIPELQLSPYESEVLRRVVKFLSQYEERQSLRSVIREVFGRSRLSRDGEGRLTQMLDAFTEAGRLRSYGKTYGYKTEADFQAATTVEIAAAEGPGEAIGDDDRKMLSYIVINAQNGEMNIGEIIRRHIGIEVLPRPQQLELIDKLNRLAGLGYLVHAPGSPWYGVGPKLQLAPQQEGPKSGWQERNFPHLENIPLPLLPDDEIALQPPLVDEGITESAAEPLSGPEVAAATDTPAESDPNAEDEPVVLDEVMQAVLEALMTGQVFRMEELKQNVPLLMAMDKKEYDAFKRVFAATGKDQIEAYLLQQGTVAELREDGKARGKKYWLEGEDVPAPDDVQPDASLRVKVSSRLRHPSQKLVIGDEEYDPGAVIPDVIMPDFSIDTSGQEVMTMQPIVRRRVLSRIALHETKAESVGLKMPAVIKIVSDATGWPWDVAVRAVRAFHKEGDLRVPADRPHKKGSKVLTTQSVESLDRAKAASGESERSREASEKEDVKQWTAQDTVVAIRVLDALLGLRHVQQGKIPKGLEQELEIPEAESPSFRGTLHKMKRRGLVIIDKNTNPNTRSNNSKRIYVTQVKIASQAIKKEWKDSREQVVLRMKDYEAEPETATKE